MIGLVIVLLSLRIVSAVNDMEIEETEFRIYALPVGQGEALVLQCPKGAVTIVDMGSSDGIDSGFWNENYINDFFKTKKIHIDQVRNIVITHNHEDHYNLIPKVFDQANKPKFLQNIYISRTFEELPDDLSKWIVTSRFKTKVRTINNGNAYCCEPNDATQSRPTITLCYTIDLCPRSDITAEVLFANLGDDAGNKNLNSIVIRIKYNEFSMVLNGDFTEVPTGKCGQGTKKELYNRMAGTTVYKLAHHGSGYKGANNDEILSVIRPKAIFVSSNPWHGNLGHPRCSRIQYLIDNQMLCKPTEPEDKSYCGPHPSSDPLVRTLQKEYTCCHNQQDCPLISSKGYAIYSTAPAEHMINLIELVTDGTKWGFINTPQKRIKSTQPSRPNGKKRPNGPPNKGFKNKRSTKKPTIENPPKHRISKKPKSGRQNLEPSPLLRRLMLGIWGSQ